MRAAIALLLAFTALAAAATPADLAPDATSPTGVKWWKTPIKSARANGFKTFAAAVTDNDLKTFEEGDWTATVFAPTDAAFKAFTDSEDPAIVSILEDADKMKALLKYHVIPGATLPEARLKELIAKAPKGVQAFKSLQGDILNTTVTGGALHVNTAAATKVEGQGGKAMIIGIDHVLIPPSFNTKAPLPKDSKAAAKKKAADAESAAWAPRRAAAAALAAAPLLAAALAL